MNLKDSFKNKREHPVSKIMDIILSRKYNIDPTENATVSHKRSVFTYNSAFKPIINVESQVGKKDLELNTSLEKLSTINKKKFITENNSRLNNTYFKLDNKVIKPMVIRAWGDCKAKEGYQRKNSTEDRDRKSFLSKKRARHDEDQQSLKYPIDNYNKSLDMSKNKFSYIKNNDNLSTRKIYAYDNEENSKYNNFFIFKYFVFIF